ncbi:hypothetical protein TTY48_22080 [Tsukamurella sp. TY48]|nr:hypothetical protein TTY48_22080 [Tsukamurella sp. TY48]
MNNMSATRPPMFSLVSEGTRPLCGSPPFTRMIASGPTVFWDRAPSMLQPDTARLAATAIARIARVAVDLLRLLT